jgi:hypothetical protein
LLAIKEVYKPYEAYFRINQVNTFVFDGLKELLNENIVKNPAFAIH